MQHDTDLQQARRRIEAAYDPEALRAAGHRLADLLADHLRKAERSEGKVLPWCDPAENVRLAGELLDRAVGQVANLPESRSADERQIGNLPHLTERFAELVQTMLDRGHNLHDPRYIGHQVPAPVPLAGLFDAVGSVTNQPMAIYDMGPWATAAEFALVERLGERIGWRRGEFAGLATHGGSLANLTGLLTARNVTLKNVWQQGVAAGWGGSATATPTESAGWGGSCTATPTGIATAAPTSNAPAPPVLVVHADAHYSVARAAGVLGLGTNQVLRVGLDAQRRIDPQQLDDMLTDLRARRHPVVAVVGCACSTPIGAFDRLGDVADVCARHGVWLHVDAAHGGAACLSGRHRHLVAGLERADSVVWDAHKMLFVPALCAFVFYRRAAHKFEAFQQDAPYLFDPAAPGLAAFDSGLRTLECTKRAAAFGLWGVWALLGPQLLADLVDVTFALGRSFYEKLSAADDFVPLHEPQCNIVAFRHVPQELRDAPRDVLGRFQFELRRRVIESGEFYIVSTKLDGLGALRVTIINPLTTAAHLDLLLETLRRTGRQLLAEGLPARL
jgi:L-2,4-diaminobutyrate decarboxylase